MASSHPNQTALNTTKIVNIEDLRRMARRRVPRSVFDYLDGGAEAEFTLCENCRVFRDVLFRPRAAVAAAECSLKTRVIGQEISFPAMLAPVGYQITVGCNGSRPLVSACGHHPSTHV